MRITIVYRYFWPDNTPYALLLAEMTPWLVADGHDVTILTGQPAYSAAARGQRRPKSETAFGARIMRAPILPGAGQGIGKKIDMAFFSLWAFLRVLFGRRQDLIWFGTMPPVFQSVPMTIAAKLRGMKSIYQMQDIHPEIAIEAGEMSASAITRMMVAADNFVLKNATVVTVLSSDMADYIASRTGGAANVRVINNFALGADDASPVHEKSGPVRICYAGNIGMFQNLEAFLEAFAEIDPQTATLEFVGDGRMRKRLEAVCAKRGLANVTFHGQKTADETFAFLKSCDIGLVSLNPGLYRFAYPTKMHTYLAAGVRLVAMVEGESALARAVRDNGLGVSVDWSSSREEIAHAIGEAVEAVLRDRNGFTVPPHIWRADAAKEKWLKLLDDLRAGTG